MISSTSDFSRPLTAFSCLLSLKTWIFPDTFLIFTHYWPNLRFHLVLGEVAQHLLLADQLHLLAQLLLQPAGKLPCCCALPTAWQPWWHVEIYIFCNQELFYNQELHYEKTGRTKIFSTCYDNQRHLRNFSCLSLFTCRRKANFGMSTTDELNLRY